jgi:hypothetical protein
MSAPESTWGTHNFGERKVKATVIPPEFWNHNLSLPHSALLIYLMGLMDKDGIGCIDISAQDAAKLNLNTDRFVRGVRQLESLGFVAVYSWNNKAYAWTPIVLKTQPPKGSLRRSRDSTLPAPPVDKVLGLLKTLYNIEDLNEAKTLCPRAWGIKRNPSTVTLPEIREVFEEWQKRQRRPSLCIFNNPVQYVINKCIVAGYSVLQLRSLIEFAYEADHPIARYWRGENDRKRKYLGLEALMRTTKVLDRLTIINDYLEFHSDKHDPNGALVAYYKERCKAPEAKNSSGINNSEASNLNRQQTQILSLLIKRGQEGVWTQELARVALKYSARISELRALGYSISVVERTEHGNNRYALRSRNTVDANEEKLNLVGSK